LRLHDSDRGLQRLLGRRRIGRVALRQDLAADAVYLRFGRAVLGAFHFGKSRLTAALRERREGEPHTRLRYFCSPHHQDSALHPFIAQLERAAGFAPDETPEQRFGKLAALIAPSARDRDEVMLIADLLSLPGGAAELDLSPQRACGRSAKR
jgi:predicted ATPase